MDLFTETIATDEPTEIILPISICLGVANGVTDPDVFRPAAAVFEGVMPISPYCVPRIDRVWLGKTKHDMQKSHNTALFKQKAFAAFRNRKKNGRGDWIRTSDPLFPKQMRYQAALLPDIGMVLLTAK